MTQALCSLIGIGRECGRTVCCKQKMLSSFRCIRFSSILNCSPQFSQITVSQGSKIHLTDEANMFSELRSLAQLLTPECSLMVPTLMTKGFVITHSISFFCNRENKLRGKQTPDPSYPFLTNSHTPFNSCSSSIPLSLETADS